MRSMRTSWTSLDTKNGSDGDREAMRRASISWCEKSPSSGPQEGTVESGQGERYVKQWSLWGVLLREPCENIHVPFSIISNDEFHSKGH
ncbi:hypothetical protein STEG23_030565 [Scotinomys teguina]